MCTLYPCILYKTYLCKCFLQILQMCKVLDNWIKHSKTSTLTSNKLSDTEKAIGKSAQKSLPKHVGHDKPEFYQS